MNAAVQNRFATDTTPASRTEGGFARGRYVDLAPDGMLQVELPGLGVQPCDLLLGGVDVTTLQPGDTLLVALPRDGGAGVVIGAVGRWQVAQPPQQLVLQATEAVNLRCGDSSLEFRADGRVLIKGEDVTIHAKGTQRIRAGTVAIN
jgi:hypothetical protein